MSSAYLSHSWSYWQKNLIEYSILTFWWSQVVWFQIKTWLDQSPELLIHTNLFFLHSSINSLLKMVLDQIHKLILIDWKLVLTVQKCWPFWIDKITEILILIGDFDHRTLLYNMWLLLGLFIDSLPNLQHMQRFMDILSFDRDRKWILTTWQHNLIHLFRNFLSKNSWYLPYTSRISFLSLFHTSNSKKTLKCNYLWFLFRLFLWFLYHYHIL